MCCEEIFLWNIKNELNEPKLLISEMFSLQKYGPKCQQAECLPITNEIKEIFLRAHNEKRNLIAQGKGDGIFRGKTASRMATLVSSLVLSFNWIISVFFTLYLRHS